MSIKLNVHGLTLQYESHTILEELEFNISPGQRVALIGGNGAGKTTLLRCISKALQPTSGSILLDEQNLKKLSFREMARTMAVVPQENRADFEFTVEEVVLMGRLPYLKRFQQESEQEKAIARQALEMTGVSHLAHRSVSTLSGGEKQRVVLARALCQEPKLLLLDEPTANLDLGYQHSLLDLVADLNTKQGITLIASIHDLNLAARFFNCMLLLAEGKILAAGTAEEVLTPNLIKKAYGVDTFIYRHPLTGCLQISVQEDFHPTLDEQPLIHVIGGGEKTLPVLEYLRTQGFRLSIGPVTPEDSSHQFASFYQIPVIEVPPFSPISEHARNEHLKLMENADLTVIPPIPIGVGNLDNLKTVETAFDRGHPAAILNDVDYDEWQDFTDGEATQILQRLSKQGAPVLKDKRMIPKLLKKGDTRN